MKRPVILAGALCALILTAAPAWATSETLEEAVTTIVTETSVESAAPAAVGKVAKKLTLAERRQLKDAENADRAYFEKAQAACGKSFKVAYDYAGFSAIPAERSRYAGGSYCGSSCAYALQLACETDEMTKEAVVDAVDGVLCLPEDGAVYSLMLDANTKMLHCSYDYSNSAFQGEVLKFLDQHF